MNRLFLLCVLSVAVAGCGDDSSGEMGGSGGLAGSGGMAGAGGMAGSAGAGGMAGAGGTGGIMLMGACLDDLGTLTPVATTIQTLIQEECVFGMGCLIDTVQCVADCLETEIGLAQDCGMCMGMTTQCVIGACTESCLDPMSAACATCTAMAAGLGGECADVFEACAGFPVPVL